jgi:hypothetical protein
LPDVRPTQVGFRTATIAVTLLAIILLPACSKAPEESSKTRVEDQLQALGYVDFVAVDGADFGKSGVTLHIPEKTSPGYNLFNTRTSNQALLIDMDGETVHTWHNHTLEGTWHHIELLPDGDLLVIDKNGYLARLGWNSELRWKRVLHAHHDVAAGPDGELYVLDRDVMNASIAFGAVSIVNDAIAAVNAEGVLGEKVYFDPLVRSQIRKQLWKSWLRRLVGAEDADTPLDVLHVNSLEYVDRDVAGLPTTGSFLVCLRERNLVAFIDLEERKVIWSWGLGVLESPHHPSLTKEGNLLIFDNGTQRRWSRVVEMNPASGEIVWEYSATPREDFYSMRRGGAQELENGNVLITESDRGRVFEVSRDGETVWEFYNPDLVKTESGENVRGAIYRMTRIDPVLVQRLISRAGSDAD